MSASDPRSPRGRRYGPNTRRAEPGDSDPVLAFDAAENAEARDFFVVDLEFYEGPLHVLLELARAQKVDLGKLSILHLAEQYLAFIADARKRRIDIAADYLVMAAWLTFLKSRLLLPKPVRPADESAPEEALEVLSFRLERLNAMREAAKALMQRPLWGRDLFGCGAPQKATPPETNGPVAAPFDLYDLMRAYGDIVRKQARRRVHTIRPRPILALAEARKRLEAGLAELKDWTDLGAVTPDPQELPDTPPMTSAVASTFFAVLELSRDGALDLRQDEAFAALFLRRSRDGVRSAGQQAG